MPARRPRLVALVLLDEPRGLTHGGDVAAPVFGAVMKQALLYLGVPPDPDLLEEDRELDRRGPSGRARAMTVARTRSTVPDRPARLERGAG